jgi:hypothetical protein
LDFGFIVDAEMAYLPTLRLPQLGNGMHLFLEGGLCNPCGDQINSIFTSIVRNMVWIMGFPMAIRRNT